MSESLPSMLEPPKIVTKPLSPSTQEKPPFPRKDGRRKLLEDRFEALWNAGMTPQFCQGRELSELLNIASTILDPNTSRDRLRKILRQYLGRLKTMQHQTRTGELT